MKKKDWSLGFALFAMVTMLVIYFMIWGTDAPMKDNLLCDTGNVIVHETSIPKSSVVVIWEVKSGPGIDVFLFTPAQYDAWDSNSSYPPTSALYMALDAERGIIIQVLVMSERYLLVLTNVPDISTSQIQVFMDWNGFPVPFLSQVPMVVLFIAMVSIALGLYLVYSITEQRKIGEKSTND